MQNEENELHMKYCAMCGNQLDDNIKFCPVCGSKQPDSIKISINEETAINRENKINDNNISKKKTPISKNKIALIITGIVILISIPVLTCFIGRNLLGDKDIDNNGDTNISNELGDEINETDKNYVDVEEENNYDADAKEDEDKDVSDDEVEQEIDEMVLVSEAAYMGKYYTEMEYTYDSSGNNIQIYCVDAYDSSITNCWNEYMSYDVAGNILISEYVEDGEVCQYFEYTYYENGILCEIYHYSSSDSQYDYTYYNEVGQKYERDLYSTRGDQCTMYYYDEHDNLIEETCMDSDDGDILYSYKYEYEYDGNGNIIKENNDEYGFSSTILYEYDVSDNLVSIVEYKDGELWYTITYTYDTYNRPIEKLKDCSEDAIDSDSTCIYEYDSYGNLIKKSYYDENGNLEDWYEYTYDFLSNVAVSADEY